MNDIMANPIVRALMYLVGLMTFAGLNAAYLVWCERKGAARIQRRTGPCEVGWAGLLQPLADGLKLMTKQLVVPDGVDAALFRLAPILAMLPGMVSLAVIPFSDTIQAREMELSALLIFAFASVGMLCVLLGGWASGNKFAIISSARAVSQNLAYEIPMLLTLITIAFISGSLNLSDIALKQEGNLFHWNLFKLEGWHIITMWISFVTFFICSIAETNRAPFDLAEAESELVAGYMTEYSSMGYGLFMMAEYINIVVAACLTTTLFLGGWGCPFGLAPGWWWFALKIYLLIFTIIWIRWTYPRTQIYRLLNLSWKVMIPFSLVNLLVTAGLIKFL